MYYYRIYGLTIASEIEIVETHQIAQAQPDVTVHVIDNRDGAMTFEFHKATRDYMKFPIDGIGGYELKNRNEINIYYNVENPDPHRVRTFLLGSALGFLMIQRGMVALHGGTVAQDGRAVLVTGVSGAGKSTVSTALFADGMEFVADDVSAVSIDAQGRVYVEPAYPQLKLCRDAALRLGYHLDELIYIDEDRDKFAVRLKDNYAMERREFAAIFEIRINDADSELRTELLTGHERLQAIMANIYRNLLYTDVPLVPECMKQYLQIASRVPVYRIWRPDGVDSVSRMTDFIKATLNANR